MGSSSYLSWIYAIDSDLGILRLMSKSLSSVVLRWANANEIRCQNHRRSSKAFESESLFDGFPLWTLQFEFGDKAFVTPRNFASLDGSSLASR